MKHNLRYYKVNYDYKKLVHYFNEITKNYIDKVQPLIYDTDNYSTYLFTLRADSNKHILELKQIKPLFLKILVKHHIKYFLSTEIGKNGLFHYHIDLIVPKSFRVKSIIDKYFANNMIKKQYPNIQYHLQKINKPQKGGYDYPIKLFNKKRVEPFLTSDFESKEFFKYMRRFSKYQTNASIYKIFVTNIFEIISYKKSKTLRYKISQLRFNSSFGKANSVKEIEEVFKYFQWTTLKSK